MNTWTDGGLAIAGRMGAMLALGVGGHPPAQHPPAQHPPAQHPRSGHPGLAPPPSHSLPEGPSSTTLPAQPPVPGPVSPPNDLIDRTDGFLVGGVSAMSDAPDWEAPTTIGAWIGPVLSAPDSAHSEPVQLEPTQLEPSWLAPDSEPASEPRSSAGEPQSSALGSLDTSDLFDSLSRRNR